MRLQSLMLTHCVFVSLARTVLSGVYDSELCGFTFTTLMMCAHVHLSSLSLPSFFSTVSGGNFVAALRIFLQSGLYLTIIVAVITSCVYYDRKWTRLELGVDGASRSSIAAQSRTSITRLGVAEVSSAGQSPSAAIHRNISVEGLASPTAGAAGVDLLSVGRSSASAPGTPTTGRRSRECRCFLV